MTYHFNIRAVSLAGLMAEAALKFNQAVEDHPAHAGTLDAARASLEAVAGILPAKEGFDLAATVTGYIGTRPEDEGPPTVASVSVNIAVGLIERL